MFESFCFRKLVNAAANGRIAPMVEQRFEASRAQVRILLRPLLGDWCNWQHQTLSRKLFSKILYDIGDALHQYKSFLNRKTGIDL